MTHSVTDVVCATVELTGPDGKSRSFEVLMERISTDGTGAATYRVDGITALDGLPDHHEAKTTLGVALKEVLQERYQARITGCNATKVG